MQAPSAAPRPVLRPTASLQQVYLGRGAADWQPMAAVHVLRRVPSLARLQFRFSFDDEQQPQDLVGELLRPAPGAALPALRHLRHLALVFPPRSIVPPTAHLPDCMSTLTQAGGQGGWVVDGGLHASGHAPAVVRCG